MTAIPAGTTLRSLRVVDGVATVDLSGGFGSGGGSLSMTARLAQLVFTATEFPDIDAVSIQLDGVPVEALGGEGIDVSTPRRRRDFDTLKPLIMVQSPLPGQELRSPFLITGENSTFENTVQISLVGEDGSGLVSTITTGTGPIVDGDGNQVWGPYEASIAYPTGAARAATLTVFSPSAERDRTNEAELSVPVRLTGTLAPGLPGASTEVRMTPDTPGGPGIIALLVDVRVGIHPGYERVVFEFENDIIPGYTVQYVEGPVRADPSYLPVAVTGDSYLYVRMSSAAGVDLTGPVFRRTYLGPTRISTGFPAIQSVVQRGDFEGVLNWVIGVRTRPPFVVTTLENPARIVIDIAAGQEASG